MPKLSRDDIIDSDNSDNSDDIHKNENNQSDDSENLVDSADIDDDTYVEKNFKPEIFFADNQRQFRY